MMHMHEHMQVCTIMNMHAHLQVCTIMHMHAHVQVCTMMHMHAHVQVCTMMHMYVWKSENNLWEFILSFHHVGPKVFNCQLWW